MDIVLLLVGFILVVVAILGSFLPVIPGPPMSWVGLLMLYLTKAIPIDYTVLGVSLGLVVTVSVLDYVIPAFGTKKMGGSRAGMIGTLIGVILAVAMVGVTNVIGFIVWPFFGALAGELINNTDRSKALKAAIGSILGYFAGTFLKFALSLGIFAYYCMLVSQNSESLGLDFSFEWFDTAVDWVKGLF